ncbi:Serine/threonine-protein kinase [Actinidia chinensis var. chinensis]|uniref:non-specific serine/threonine protein kinase n=1 Tax=Actinidia chinensis var. chinensis TaxID=1590841 RepID=A0A2R6R6I5_ACTCC|nr:Serine/threonine-protein kinase [Actinidia chinensis var. chinensis]
MGTRTGGSSIDLWSELIAAEEEEENRHQSQPQQQQEPQIAVVYGRKIAENSHKNIPKRLSNSSNENRVSLVPTKRVSWNRSLSTRGRTSIAVAACVDYQHQQRKPKRKTKPAIPRAKPVQPPNYKKEQAYFQEVDSFELLEESPSPKKSGTWAMGIQRDDVAIPHVSTVLKKWLISKKLHRSSGPLGSLSRILETPALPGEFICNDGIGYSGLKTPVEASLQIHSGLQTAQNKLNSSFIKKDAVGDECREDIEVAVGKLSLTSRPDSLDGHQWDPFLALLAVCGQPTPSMLLDVFSKYCDPESIIKVGEGTYGEAFAAGKAVCKIVPIDGDLRVNGEVQKRSEELLEEAILSRTLNHLRGRDGHVSNSCTTFIETIELKVCQGPYDAALIRAWEEWDTKHGSENDHPKEFPQKQCYVVFVQEYGGQDLESFVLLNFNEARSLLAQVTVALAVAESAYEFEHRDLHWGNILLSRKDSATVQFSIEGRQIFIRTFGLWVSIIDFTLSRINTGEDILFLDLSLDPELFEGPKGDKQSDTYRKMKEVTEECWEGSFPKTNVLWLQYLVDILLLKKSYDRTSKDERELRSLKKRLNGYNSARAATSDPFFGDLFVSHAM